MDELKGPNIQIILHVKEGLGFGFLRSPFTVSGSLNGYLLDTDPVVPCHAPIFDAELVWEADKRRFRSLRIQNVPIKVEVYTSGTQGRKDKVGYLLLSLLAAQPCPANKIVDVKHTWHRLLGVKSEGKCCHPQLLLSLSIEDRITTLTPRNELRMFYSNETACPTSRPSNNPPPGRSMLLSLEEYITESNKTVSSLELKPKFLSDEGLIQIGDGKHLFVLSFVFGALENLECLLPDNKENTELYVTYSIFTHNITTDSVSVRWSGGSGGSGGLGSAQVGQRSSLRVCGSLARLLRYFLHCPLLVAQLQATHTHQRIGICSMDLRKLIPTEDLDEFIKSFCNEDKCIVIQERCFLLRCDEKMDVMTGGRRPFMDVEMSLKYVGVKLDNVPKPNPLTARSVTQLESARKKDTMPSEATLDFKSGSCTNFEPDGADHAYTNNGVSNTARYKSGDGPPQTNEICELIKKMCASLSAGQERLMGARPAASDVQVQCDAITIDNADGKPENIDPEVVNTLNKRNYLEREPVKSETSRSDTFISRNEKDIVKAVIPSTDRDSIMQKFVDELEDWKERQQELFKCQLKRKEDYHLELLSKEWSKKRLELECKLSAGIEQCRNLAGELSRATDDFRLRGYRNTEREKKLLEAKKALESHYTAKYQELREASQKMEDDMNHRLKMKDLRVEELELKVQQLEKQTHVLKTNLKNNEKEAETKYSGLTKDQTASLIQELRCLEEKLDSAVQSKAFFKEQWGRAVRELHLLKLGTRRQMLSQLRTQRKQLGDMGLDTIQDQEENNTTESQVDLKKLKDDFYVDLLANTPGLDAHSIISSSGPDGIDIFEDLKISHKNPINDKLSDLITQRDILIQQENPDEDVLKQLNHEIRNMLLNCNT